MEPATWDNCRADFVFDGALIDLIVPGCGPREWELFWPTLRSGPFQLRGERDGEPFELPETIFEILKESETATMLASVLVDPITVNCHFFGGELDLDIDPREVVNEKAFESVLTFMRFVAGAIGRPVLAVPERSFPSNAFLHVTPAGQPMFIPPRSTG
jgi:hypothetical protein